MMQIVLIGIGAGAAAALLFASVASGSPLSVPLFYLAPLPILIAAIGWSHWAALIAAVVAAAGLAAVFGWFVLHRLPDRHRPAGVVARLSGAAGAPGAADARRARMVSGRPSGVLGRDPRRADRDRRDADARHRRWTASAPRCAAASSACCDSRPARRQMRRCSLRAPDPSRLLDILVAGRAAGRGGARHHHQPGQSLARRRDREDFGRLRRPAADLSAMQFPALRAGAVGARGRRHRSCPASSASSAGVFAASLLIAYAMLGFAVLHAITRGIGSRPFMLGGIYVAVVVFGWPVAGDVAARPCRHRASICAAAPRAPAAARPDHSIHRTCNNGERPWK